MDDNHNNNNTVAAVARTRRPHHRGTPAERRRLFLKAILAGRSPEESLTEAGFHLVGRKAIASTISSLRKDPTVRAALDAEQRSLDSTIGNTPARLEEMLTDMASTDIALLFNEDGSPRLPSQIPPKVRAAIHSLNLSYNLNPDGTRTVRRASFVLENKIQAIELLAELRGYIRGQEAIAVRTQAFQINIHLDEEGRRVSAARNNTAYLKPVEIEQATQLPPPDEPRN